MSRLNDLLRRLENNDPALAKDLKREVDALADRRAFGLNFERHAPEAVELPGRPVRRADKVRILAPRGSKASAGDQRLWRVVTIAKDFAGAHMAALELIGDEDETAEALVDDLVVVAEFRDPIYPGLVSTGKVERGEDKPYHAVINAENYHALQTLLFTHRAKVDAIYIDPPYNTGAKDWKYNNDYVEGEDLYRHSKWLAFMERRLKLAKQLLNPDDSVLIVTIDEKEVLRLGLLLSQVFPDCDIQLVTIITNHAGSVRRGRMTRVEEYAFIVFVGDAVTGNWSHNMLSGDGNTEGQKPTVWFSATRTGGAAALRKNRTSPVLFYPVHRERATGVFHSVGNPLPLGADRSTHVVPEGTDAIWPLASDGSEQTWQVSGPKLAKYFGLGYARFGSINRATALPTVMYLRNGTIDKVNSGEYVSSGRAADGSIEFDFSGAAANRHAPTSVWYQQSHFARDYGTQLLSKLVEGRPFPFPKSLYAVEDTLRFFVGQKPDSVVVDFFAGSGTTAHAVMRLNKQDGGRRRSISVSNNEVSADEQKTLRGEGRRPGDPEWEQWGICDYITKPRIEAAITGKTPNGVPIKGDYKFTDKFSMADGFEENVEFFTLTYEAPLRVSSNREFAKIAPLLWLRAGAEGRRIDEVSAGWDVADTYGVLADLNLSDAFVNAIAAKPGIQVAFIVTDEDRLFEAVVRELPDHVEAVRLYEAYLHNFEIETGRSAL